MFGGGGLKGKRASEGGKGQVESFASVQIRAIDSSDTAACTACLPAKRSVVDVYPPNRDPDSGKWKCDKRASRLWMEVPDGPHIGNPYSESELARPRHVDLATRKRPDNDYFQQMTE